MKNTSKNYEKLMKIGEGAYGAVYKARDTTTNSPVALKITKFDTEDEGVPSTALREISILKTLSHPNIVKLLDISYIAEKGQCMIQLVFEFVNEDLGKFIRRNKDNLRQKEYKVILQIIKYIFQQIVNGVKYMHDRKIYHRDLKPQNILINDQNEIKIADFGLSRVVVNPNKTLSKQIETLWYRSPELLLGVKYYQGGVDTWSLGCILYQLVEGKVLFKGDSEISQIFTIFQFLGTPRTDDWPEVVNLQHFKKSFPKMNPKMNETKNFTVQGLDLLFKLICMNPEKRIKINEILSHPFFCD